MRLLILNTVEANTNAHLAEGAVEGFRAVLGAENVVFAGYADAAGAFRKARCDAFLAFGGQSMRVPIIKELLRISPLNLLWATGDPEELALSADRAAWFDWVFTTDRGSAAGYGGKASHVPLGAREGTVPIFVSAKMGLSPLMQTSVQSPREQTRPPIPFERRYRDVFFSGAAWPSRAAILRELIPKLDGLRTQFFLPARDGLPNPALPIPEHEWDVRLGPNDFCTAARYSKIVLYLERDDCTNDSRSNARSPSSRLFETAALGVAQVAIADPATIAPYFEPGKEIAVAATADEAARLIRELLADSARLESLGQAARQRVLAEHTYAHRARAIVEKASQIATTAVRAASDERGSPGVIQNITDVCRNHAPPARLRVLHVLRDAAGEPSCADAQWHAGSIQRGLAEKFEFHTLFTRHNRSEVVLVHQRAESGVERTLAGGSYNAARQWIAPERDAIFQKLLIDEDIDLVHFLDLSGHSLGYIPVAKALGRPMVLGAYEFFPACCESDLIDDQGRFCGLPAIETCDQCLWAKNGLAPGAQWQRRALMSKLVAAADRVHFLSQSQRALIERVVPVAPGQAFVQGIGVPRPESTCGPLPPPPLRVAVVGDLAPNQGAEAIFALVRRLRTEPIQFTVLGGVQNKYRPAVAELRRLGAVVRQLHRPEEIGERLQGHHVALFASPRPEAFSTALSAAFHAGAVPIAPAVGAIAERIRDGENGLLTSSDVGSSMRALLLLLDSPPLLSRLRERIAQEAVFSPADDLRGWESLYGQLAARYGLPGTRRAVVGDQDSYLPISTTAMGPASFPIAGQPGPVWQRALRLYRAAGPHAIVRKAWHKVSNWRRIA